MSELKFTPVVEEPVQYSGDVARRYKAIVNPENRELYGIVSKDYKLVTHTEMLNMVEEVLQEFPEYGTYCRGVWQSSNGGQMRAVYKFPKLEFPVSRKVGDVVNPTINAFNSYGLGWTRGLDFGAHRLVCSNGLTVSQRLMRWVRTHLQPVLPADIRFMLAGSLERFSNQTEIWRTWVDKVVQPEQYINVMSHLPFNMKEEEEVSREVELSSDIKLEDIKTRTLTLWVFYNILCQYITHRVSTERRKFELQQRMKNLF